MMLSSDSKSSSNPLFYALIVLAIGLIARAALLAQTDLIDPTESRYAWISQFMVSSGNWLTPMLPMPEGIVPYLGKPPLHFWLAAASYSVFGVDEWVSRLPSFLATLGILLSIAWVGTRMLGRATATAGALIFFSAAMPFFLAGASVIDVTLTCFVTASTACLYVFATAAQPQVRFGIAAAVFAALGFLCKGPVSVVLAGTPVLLFSLVMRDLSWMRRFPWLRAALVFLAIIAPWFILNEIHNPGFIKYFVWNENIARYLFKEYGDKYGHGHVRPYGMSWVMLIAAFVPWTFVIGYRLFRTGVGGLKTLFVSNPHFVFLILWSATTPLFFTFVRQLHPLYILPGMPALSLLTAALLSREALELSGDCAGLKTKWFCTALLTTMLILIVVGLSISTPTTPTITGVIAAVVTLGCFITLRSPASRTQTIPLAAAALFAVYTVGAVASAPMINQKRSSELVMHAIVAEKSCAGSLAPHTVGVFSDNTYSYYWAANAWRTELGEEVNVRYVEPSEAVASGVCHYLLRAKLADQAPQAFKDNFAVLGRYGGTLLYMRNQDATPAVTVQ